MLQVVRTTRAYVAFVIAVVGSTVMYCKQARCVLEAGSMTEAHACRR